ncbi:hypothetical protein GCM10011321_07010 [Youhaiella tibetensis]|uniref:Uncharacterized protein n=1 Tax=Paradevosia tibetensis TaxID=1447062 RepID=A0A5B9DQS2_9HYPH|nr:hypothetical protein [Youhaiella tibetensis]AKR56067.1 hypothetical protein XM25_09695 [Devosia sp. H5989]QEE21119.1 hypothetical protein FNA67_13445 [Youhaiella tibetensis]GGF17860.1 hypothetical protein GCM10011321_07010 [Youhaiella tibetensis]
MFKRTAIAFASIALLAAPAMASSSLTTDSFNKDHVISSLQERGVNVQDAERWGTFIRAFVKQADGTVKSELFQPNTLAPVTNLADVG